jgi:hypothetical protein
MNLFRYYTTQCIRLPELVIFFTGRRLVVTKRSVISVRAPIVAGLAQDVIGWGVVYIFCVHRRISHATTGVR